VFGIFVCLTRVLTNIMSSNPAHGEVNLIQHYVIKFCQWLAAGL